MPRAKSKLGAWIDRTSFRAAEFLNPILIKEGRQALKSRGFSVPFLLVLLACLFWSFLGVSINENVYYGAVGWDFFSAYYLILAFPLLVIVPFGAFRSLTGEREDGTYELLSITTLRPLQIVNGKLASALMQMAVYLSAVAPCIAFTYLLRGIDLFAIATMLFWLVSASLLLSVFCLMLATLTTAKHWQVLMSVMVIAALMFIFFSTFPIVLEGELQRLPWGLAVETWEFWAGSFATFSGVSMIGALSYSVAHAQLKFPTDNRSTSVRIVMLLCSVVYTSWIGWASYTFSESADDVIAPIAISAAFFFPFWFIMGAFLVGEYGELSRRIRRTLPKTMAGRMFTAWFIPGSGTGYVFTICCAGAGSIFGIVMGFYADLRLPNTNTMFRFIDTRQLVQILVYFPLYLVFYLSIGRLLVVGLRKRIHVGVVASLLLHLIILATGCIVPFAVDNISMQTNFRDMETRHIIETTNVFWVLIEAYEDNISGTIFALHLLGLGGVSMILILLNLNSVIKEIRQQRVAEPKRVREEKAAQAGPPAPALPTNPFSD